MDTAPSRSKLEELLADMDQNADTLKASWLRTTDRHAKVVLYSKWGTTRFYANKLRTLIEETP